MAFSFTKVNLRRFTSVMAVSAITAWATPTFAAAPVVNASSGGGSAADARIQSLEQQVEVRNRVIADMQIQITTLQEELRMLRGQVEEQEFKLSQILDRQRDLYRDIDSRLSALNQASTPSLPAANTTTPTTTAEQPVTTVTAQVATTTAKNTVSAKDAQSEAAAYDAIFPLVRNRQYAEAVTAYQDFLKTYPNGKNAQNAHYWLGQVYYVTSQWEEAETQFKVVATRYVDSSRASDALLKLGEIEKRRGNADAARAYFQQVLSKYAGTSAAQAAQKSLQDLR
ncbi:tol-pal system protein YbgF [Permianibacter aggregans]|uniref:Cell division coordinator CpoB n=2 Tax=Permianibacter aggregans TaxID=1510150 RepID=A0A4R6URD8_9GAMM|nr:tol-pal system protein YbgF [Permianibacter aggregans]